MTMQIQNRPIVSSQNPLGQKPLEGPAAGQDLFALMKQSSEPGKVTEDLQAFDLALKSLTTEESVSKKVAELTKNSKKIEADPVVMEVLGAQSGVVQQAPQVIRPMIMEGAQVEEQSREGIAKTKLPVRTEPNRVMDSNVKLPEVQGGETPKSTSQKDIVKPAGPQPLDVSQKLAALQPLALKGQKIETAQAVEGSISQPTRRKPVGVDQKSESLMPNEVSPEWASMVEAMEYVPGVEAVAVPEKGPKEIGKKSNSAKSSALKAALSGEEFLSTMHSAKNDKVIPLSDRLVIPQAKMGVNSDQELAKPTRAFQKGISKGLDEVSLPQSNPLSNVQQGTHLASGGPKMMELTAHVVPGSMAQDRLTHDAVVGIGSQIKNISQSGGSGEIRVRLKPDNLGEIHLRIVSDGKNVELKIQAKDEKTRQIIEESMSSLRESLATHSLELSQVEVAQHMGSNSSDDSQPQDQGRQYNSRQDGNAFAQNSGNPAWGERESQGESRSSRQEFTGEPRLTTVKPGLASRSYSNPTNGEATRLDVRV